VRGVEVEPSLCGADFSRLGEQVGVLMAAGCRVVHFDVGDGHFVEPVTMGPIVLQSISPIVHERGRAIDVHLMVERPAKYFEAVAAAGGDSVTFHFEAVDDVPATIDSARGCGLGAGVAFNPETEPEQVAPAADTADLVLCMSIHPGYSGQPFRPETFDRVERLRAQLPKEVRIQVDGGVGATNIRELRDSGATLLVAALSVFAHDDPPRAYRELVDAVS
jgi:ribulose-phosphate 3-epimerase